MYEMESTEYCLDMPMTCEQSAIRIYDDYRGTKPLKNPERIETILKELFARSHNGESDLSRLKIAFKTFVFEFAEQLLNRECEDWWWLSALTAMLHGSVSRHDEMLSPDFLIKVEEIMICVLEGLAKSKRWNKTPLSIRRVVETYFTVLDPIEKDEVEPTVG